MMLSLILGVSSAMAASTTGNMNVSASLVGTCALSTQNVAFGVVTPAATGKATAMGILWIQCSNGTNATITLDKGTGTSILARSMGGTGSNTDRLNYNLYADSGYHSVWGNTTTGSYSIAIGDSTNEFYNVYGAIPLNQYVKSDTYSDSVTVTLTY